MPPQRGDITYFHGSVFQRFVLHREVIALRIRRLVVKLDSSQVQRSSIYLARVHWNSRQAAFQSGNATVRKLHGRPRVGRLEVEIELEWIVVAKAWRASAILEGAVINAISATENQLAGSGVSKSES